MSDTFARIEREIIRCRSCPRLVEYREKVAREKRRAYRNCEYWGRPVPGFGDPGARLVLVGLAPGAHGSNRTGRMFTGDASGDTLFEALHAHGFASSPEARGREDGLELRDCFITAAVRCAPPGNRPLRDEHERCFPFLLREMRLLRGARVYMALGRVGFDALRRVLPMIGMEPMPSASRFGHGTAFPIDGGRRELLCSYHPSRQNTQTGRLTRGMVHAVFRRVRRCLDGAS